MAAGEIHFTLDTKAGTVSMALGATGSFDRPCKPGKHYVYVHKGPDGTVFYVGKGTGNRAYSEDRGPDWNWYVKNVLGGQFSVELVRKNVSPADALELEDLLMQRFGATIINLQNFHSPLDQTKFTAYSDAMKLYADERKNAEAFAVTGRIGEAMARFGTAYDHYRVAMQNSDYDLGARRRLRESGLYDYHPAALADAYTKMLAKSARYDELVAFGDRYVADFKPPYTKGEEIMRRRVESARAKSSRMT
jgi:hypothetical protein